MAYHEYLIAWSSPWAWRWVPKICRTHDGGWVHWGRWLLEAYHRPAVATRSCKQEQG
jgi:hypothetical protein